MLILSAITYGAVLLLSSPQHMLRGVSAQGVPTDLTPECSTLLCDTMKQVTTCPVRKEGLFISNKGVVLCSALYDSHS